MPCAARSRRALLRSAVAPAAACAHRMLRFATALLTWHRPAARIRPPPPPNTHTHTPAEGRGHGGRQQVALVVRPRAHVEAREQLPSRSSGQCLGPCCSYCCGPDDLPLCHTLSVTAAVVVRWWVLAGDAAKPPAMAPALGRSLPPTVWWWREAGHARRQQCYDYRVGMLVTTAAFRYHALFAWVRLRHCPCNCDTVDGRQ